MSDDRTVLEHLLDGRQALVVEVTRLTTAIAELDVVIERIGGGTDRIVASSTTWGPATAVETAATPSRSPGDLRPADHAATPPAVEPESSARRQSRKRSAPARTSKARARATASPPVKTGGVPKSIRVRVLEMLGEENREFGLAEVIDRVHAAGIQAHDDAVRSITIKLMKDGKVERVGRGQYRLVRPSDPRGESPASGTAVHEGPAVTDLADDDASTGGDTTGHDHSAVPRPTTGVQNEFAELPQHEHADMAPHVPWERSGN